MSKLYKVLAADGSARRGTGKWPLPVDGKPGAWLEIEGEIEPCRNGLHLCRRQDLVVWLGPAIYEAEHEGELIAHSDKVVARKARLIRRIHKWNERTARLFAADCVERVLPIFERVYPNDPRPRNAVEAARAYARGEIDAAAAQAAAEAARASWAAAWAAAWAGRTAAWAAAKAAWAARNAAGAARADRAAAWAARDAAWAALAARDAAWALSARDAAWAAERKWQTTRLFRYLNGEA